MSAGFATVGTVRASTRPGAGWRVAAVAAIALAAAGFCIGVDAAPADRAPGSAPSPATPRVEAAPTSRPAPLRTGPAPSIPLVPPAPPAGAATPEAPARLALVVRDAVPLRAAPRDAAAPLASLWQGELLEVRGERAGYLQVWNHGRERGGFVRASLVHRTSTQPGDAPGLLAVVRFVRDVPGSEALGIGLATAWLQAAPAAAVRGEDGAEVFEAIGDFADRLADRANAGGAAAAAERAVAHLEVAARYGIRWKSFERDGKVVVCSDGEAWSRVLASGTTAARRVLGVASNDARVALVGSSTASGADAVEASSAARTARAVLGSTRGECVEPTLAALERAAVDERRASLLDGVELASLPVALRNRVALRRAEVWSTIAWRRSRGGDASAAAAASRALVEWGRVVPAELGDDEQAAWNDASMRVNATRWIGQAEPPAVLLRHLALHKVAGEPGQTCLELGDTRRAGAAPLLRRCTFGSVQLASASLNREGNAIALAVQTSEAWRELWLLHAAPNGREWTVDVLPPATLAPGLGYAEFAGWVPGGRQLLVAREARGEGRYRRSYEVVRIDTLAIDRQAFEATALGPFQRWTDAAWKRDSVALR